MANHKIPGVGTISSKGGVKLSAAAAKAAGHRNGQGVDYPRNQEVRAAQRKAILRAAEAHNIGGPFEVFDGSVQVDELDE